MIDFKTQAALALWVSPYFPKIGDSTTFILELLSVIDNQQRAIENLIKKDRMQPRYGSAAYYKETAEINEELEGFLDG